MMKWILHLILFLAAVSPSFGQTQLQGKISNAENAEPLLFCSVALYKDSVLVKGTETDFDGNYFFSDLDAGKYDLEVTYVGYATKLVIDVKVIANKINSRDIEMKEAPITDEIVVTSCVGPPRGLLKGSVLDEHTSEPIVLSTVTLYKDGVLIAGADTDLDGHYLFNDLKPGLYDVEVSYVGYQTKRIEKVKVMANDIITYNILMDDSNEIVMGCGYYSKPKTGYLIKRKRPSHIRGTVTSEDGAPIMDVRVTIMRKNKNLSTIETDSLGGYDMGNLKVGRYKVKYRSEGYGTVIKRVRIRINKGKEIDVKMEELNSIKVK